MPYLGLKGNGLLAGIALSSGMGFVLFGKYHHLILCSRSRSSYSLLSLIIGYDDGVIGGLLTSPTFESTFHLSSSMQGTVTSLFIIGCLVGCLFTGITNGRWGRLTITHAGSIILSIGATLQASSFGVPQLIVGRIVAGIGLGLITSNVIVWQSESAPRKVRGMLVASALSLLIVGQVGFSSLSKQPFSKPSFTITDILDIASCILDRLRNGGLLFQCRLAFSIGLPSIHSYFN